LWAGFTYQIDWENNAQLPDLGTLDNNNNDGRLFREQANVGATYLPRSDGILVSIAATRPRRTSAGLYTTAPNTASLLQSRTLTNAAWTAAGMTVTKNATGADGVANSAFTLTATAPNATLTQSITNASANRHWQLDVMAGSTNAFDMSLDGTTWTGKTAPANFDTFNPVWIQQTVTNAVHGIRLANIGDSIIVDFPLATGVTAGFENCKRMERVVTTTAGINPGHCRQAALSTDAGPGVGLLRGRWSGYFEFSVERASGGFIFTGASNTFLNMSGGNVQFIVGTGTATVPLSAINYGLRARNRVSVSSRADATLDLAVNGVLCASTPSGNPDGALDHWDLMTNGAGNNGMAGYCYRLGLMTAPLSRAQLQLLSLG
jgi:hypothetical protein